MRRDLVTPAMLRSADAMTEPVAKVRMSEVGDSLPLPAKNRISKMWAGLMKAEMPAGESCLAPDQRGIR